GDVEEPDAGAVLGVAAPAVALSSSGQEKRLAVRRETGRAGNHTIAMPDGSQPGDGPRREGIGSRAGVSDRRAEEGAERQHANERGHGSLGWMRDMWEDEREKGPTLRDGETGPMKKDLR